MEQRVQFALLRDRVPVLVRMRERGSVRPEGMKRRGVYNTRLSFRFLLGDRLPILIAGQQKESPMELRRGGPRGAGRGARTVAAMPVFQSSLMRVFWGSAAAAAARAGSAETRRRGEGNCERADSDVARPCAG